MTNPELAALFSEIADLLEIQNANPFRIRAYRNASRTIRTFTEPISDIHHDPDRKLTDLPGIGKDLAEKISIVMSTGDLPMRRELLNQIPSGLLALLKLPGLGPKRAAILHQELGITSLSGLRQAIKSKRVRAINGFGAKTEETLLHGIEHLEEVGQQTYLSQAIVEATEIVTHLKTVPALGKISLAGSLRRRKETVRDIDILVTSTNPAHIMDSLADCNRVNSVLSRGDTKMRVRLGTGLELDLRVVTDDSYGAALQYFTGSKEHNIRIRKRAIERGLKVNEYGVFQDNERIAGKNEKDVYEVLDLTWMEPELREDRGEIGQAATGSLPQLIDLPDLKGDLHMHTTATDGRASIQEMIIRSIEHGHQYIAITDHSKRVTMAGGLDETQLRKHWDAIDTAAEQYPSITVLKGIEVDILEDGSLDLPDSVLRDADWVIASLHYGQKQPGDVITRRLLNAVENPSVSAIGHPTGRLIGRRRSYDVDLNMVFKAAAEYGCMLELNAQPSRLDLDDIACMAAKKHGIPIVINSDAHSLDDLSGLQFGVFQARRAGLLPSDVANTRSLSELQQMIR